MLPVSDTLLAAVRGSHEAVTTVTLCDPPGQVGVTPTGTVLAVVAGSVTLDGDADVRGTLDLTLAEKVGDPTAADVGVELLPYGAELFVTRGIVLTNGATESVPLGYFRVMSVEQDEAPTGVVRVTGQDRMIGIIEDRPLVNLTAGASLTFGQVFTAVVQDTYPGATIDWDETVTRDTAIGRQIISEDSRYEFLVDVATAAGKIFYWDYRGHLRVETVPDPDTPVFTVDAGANGVLTTVSRVLSREGVHNVAVVRGEGPDQVAPVAVVVYDGDEESPTYAFGPYGRNPVFFTSPLITTQDQAERAAEALLERSLGLPYDVDFSMVPNPALTPFDPVLVKYPIDLTAVPHVRKETHVIRQIRIPLDNLNVMSAQTRRILL